MNWKQKPAIPDIGILAGRDPVAMDAAALTFIAERAAGRLDEVLYAGIDAWEQIRHGEKIGLGRKEFILETVD